MAAGGYLFARYMVLGALSGASRDSPDPVELAQSYFESYVSALFYPVDLLGFTLPSLFGNQSQNVTIVLSVALVMMTALVFLLNWKKPGRKPKTYLFLLSWIIAFYLVCVYLKALKPWYFYIPSIPATILLVKSIQDLKAYGRRIKRRGKVFVFLKVSIVVVVLFLSLITAGLVFYSPLIADYPEWKDSGVICKKALNEYQQDRYCF